MNGGNTKTNQNMAIPCKPRELQQWSDEGGISALALQERLQKISDAFGSQQHSIERLQAAVDELHRIIRLMG